ncbi:general amidase gmdB [Aspergillus sclerotiicarbonarius CBS 121057]|uniref:amidase n=1 Tax=Aspergillus sclerotiicarbonarius (strain CBS 121057 / IBT 28362) TaxID=1448318 RepID=A0A319EH80_ASPSB|nr:general amidase gmdB [Aspergillus sclerotiicarbonarius CBS 121057]
MMAKLSPSRDLVAQKRHECQEKIPSEWTLSKDLLAVPPRLLEYDLPRRGGLLSEFELDLTENFSATQLLAKLASGQVGSLAVTTAFCKRAAIAQQVTSCLTETFFSQALDRARFLDTYLAREGKPIGPLHGLPISIKDSFCVKGVQSTKQKNSALVEMLLQLGAVLYVKTNLPQTAMTADSENNIFGRTLNPHNTFLTAGGSSGGEGALVAFRGSILGVGTDVAGSIRIPSLCCGIYGFKPTANRIPYGGQVQGSMKGLPGLTAAAGPLAHSIEDLQLFMKVTVGDGQAWEYDETAVGVPWLFDPRVTDKRNGSLKIGVLPEDKNFPLHPPVKRALERAIAALTRDGHRIIRIDNQDKDELSVAYASRLAYQYFTYGPHASMDRIKASSEPLVKSVARFDSPLFSGPLPVDQQLEPFQKIEQLHIVRQRVSDAWRQVWVEQKLDAILAPGAQNTAVGHDTYGWPPYTVIWNVLDYPACIIPFDKASKEQDPEIMVTGDAVQPDYHPDEVDGAPCAIQVITPRFQDEKCLWAADIIDRSIHA